MDLNCNIYGYTTGIFGTLLIVSEFLGIMKKIPANSIIHFFYLCTKHLMQKKIINKETIVETLAETFIDIEEEEINNNEFKNIT